VREQRKDLPLFHARFEPQCLVEVPTGKSDTLDRLVDTRVVAAAGVGRFESFITLLTGSGARVVDAIQFPDHHHYRREDVDRVIGRAQQAAGDLVLTTEKDAVKLDRLVRQGESVWAVRLTVRIEPPEPWDAMLDRLAERVRRLG
jgi:tetraacyldisaccharide 4'-kinase